MRIEMRAFTRLTMVPVLMGISCWAQEAQTQKPVCNSENRGMTWPERISGHDHVPVEICSVHFRKYKWRPITVDVSDFVKGPKPRKGNGTVASASTPAPPPAEPAPDLEQSAGREPSRR
jgi:hypothetical protein